MKHLFLYKLINDEKSIHNRFGTILVLKNHERVYYNHIQIQQFSKFYRNIVIRQRLPESHCNLCAQPDDFDDPCMYEYFTPYGKIYITNNINPLIGLANGTPCIMKSISFNNDEYEIYVKTEIEKMKPGDIFTLDQKPISINVELFTIYDKQFNIIQNNIQKNKCNRWINERKLLILDPKQQNVIIPITKIKLASRKFNSFAQHTKSQDFYKAHFQSFYSVISAFAITLDKAQKQILSHGVILVLSYRNERI